MNQVLETIAKRSSIRAYKPEPITDEELHAVISAGLQAPTATNKQEIHFTVIKGDNPNLKTLDDAIKSSIAGYPASAKPFHYDAPYLIVLSAKEDFYWSGIDAGIAVENMSIAAESMGLGSIIIGMIQMAYRKNEKADIDKLMGIPEGYKFQIAIGVGYKATEKAPHTYNEENQVSYL